MGARTGLANVVTALCLLASLVLTPWVEVVGRATVITAPALVLVGLLMLKAAQGIDWNDTTEAAPAFSTPLLMPLTFNISHGLAAGIILYPLVKLVAGKGREVHWLLCALAVLFVLRYALLPA